ncbi:putative anti-sigma regulatory factor serine/threonine protein kinase [Calothrix sp. NIES-2100]|uniref:ATP-binding protein n=1 Tax=Calothrix sp. NIES-2100 TaxID=1954172 RepID=UPI000B5FF490|nr:putative anti-sigma regulatory factor serine/threonine protein kinase [Calothrix sp. NIES-2100]
MEPLTVDGTLDSLSDIAKYVMAAAAAADLDKKTSYRLRLAVDEIATNIIVHGYEEAGREGTVVCQTTLTDDSLTITLEDTGEFYDPTKQAFPDDMDLPMEQRKIGGLGVYLTIQGVDKFTYERANNKNRNIFVVNRIPSTATGTVPSSTAK